MKKKPTGNNDYEVTEFQLEKDRDKIINEYFKTEFQKEVVEE